MDNEFCRIGTMVLSQAVYLNAVECLLASRAKNLLHRQEYSVSNSVCNTPSLESVPIIIEEGQSRPRRNRSH
jgi:hypothetical protein